MTIQEVKKILDIDDAFIASIFGFANANSYRNSSKKADYDFAIVSLYRIIRAKTLTKQKS